MVRQRHGKFPASLFLPSDESPTAVPAQRVVGPTGSTSYRAYPITRRQERHRFTLKTQIKPQCSTVRIRTTIRFSQSSPSSFGALRREPESSKRGPKSGVAQDASSQSPLLLFSRGGRGQRVSPSHRRPIACLVVSSDPEKATYNNRQRRRYILHLTQRDPPTTFIHGKPQTNKRWYAWLKK